LAVFPCIAIALLLRKKNSGNGCVKRRMRRMRPDMTRSLFLHSLLMTATPIEQLEDELAEETIKSEDKFGLLSLSMFTVSDLPF
jgi:hypothetical protein